MEAAEFLDGAIDVIAGEMVKAERWRRQDEAARVFDLAAREEGRLVGLVGAAILLRLDHWGQVAMGRDADRIIVDLIKELDEPKLITREWLYEVIAQAHTGCTVCGSKQITVHKPDCERF